MPLYHFHSANGERVFDRDGTVLPNDAAARIEAIRLVGEVLRQSPDHLTASGEWRVEVTDVADTLLFCVVTTITAGRRGDA